MKRHATSLAELSAIFEKNVITLQKYGHLGCPCQVKDKDDQGRYSVTAIRRWLKANHHFGKRPPNPKGRGAQQVYAGTDTERLRRAQADERKAKAALVQLELQQREGELHSIADCDDRTRKRHLYMLRTLKTKARTMGPRLAGKTAIECQAAMEAMVEEIMRTFSGEAER